MFPDRPLEDDADGDRGGGARGDVATGLDEARAACRAPGVGAVPGSRASTPPPAAAPSGASAAALKPTLNTSPRVNP